MDLQIKLNDSSKAATIGFAGGEGFGFLAQWRSTLGQDTHPYRVDSVDFAELAHHRYLAHSKLQPYVQAVSEYAEHIGNNPHSEVACVAFLKCDWFPDSDTLGLVHFRRTWCNRIVLDYLCAHPFISKPPEKYANIVKGVGSALLYFVVQVARSCGSDLIWGEATQNSWKFYQGVFKLDSVKDLIYVPKDIFEAFASRLESSWKGADKPSASQVLEEIYTIEAETPPFVGSKTAVFSPIQLITRHLLELPLPQKLEVARALNASGEASSAAGDFELCSRIIQTANKSGEIGKLWKEVESRHPRGRAEPNPFLR